MKAISLTDAASVSMGSSGFGFGWVTVYQNPDSDNMDAGGPDVGYTGSGDVEIRYADPIIVTGSAKPVLTNAGQCGNDIKDTGGMASWVLGGIGAGIGLLAGGIGSAAGGILGGGFGYLAGGAYAAQTSTACQPLPAK
jgi:hypothetical protein